MEHTGPNHLYQVKLTGLCYHSITYWETAVQNILTSSKGAVREDTQCWAGGKEMHVKETYLRRSGFIS